MYLPQYGDECGVSMSIVIIVVIVFCLSLFSRLVAGERCGGETRKMHFLWPVDIWTLVYEYPLCVFLGSLHHASVVYVCTLDLSYINIYICVFIESL